MGKMLRRLFLIGLALLLACGVLVGGILAFVLSLTAPVVETSDAFLTSLRDSDYATAYSLLSETEQVRLGSANGLAAEVARQNIVPAAWTTTAREIIGGEGATRGGMTLADGRSGRFDLAFASEGAVWRVTAFRFEVGGG